MVVALWFDSTKIHKSQLKYNYFEGVMAKVASNG